MRADFAVNITFMSGLIAFFSCKRRQNMRTFWVENGSGRLDLFRGWRTNGDTIRQSGGATKLLRNKIGLGCIRLRA
jgi:hypothetical protein